MPAPLGDEPHGFPRLTDPNAGARCGCDGLVSLDSRKIAKGHVFAALAGSHAHGHIRKTCARGGAAAILTDPEGARIIGDLPAQYDASPIVVEEPRAALAQAAALWYGAQPDTVVAVTDQWQNLGRQFYLSDLMALGFEAVNIGTTGWKAALPPRHPYNPDPLTLHALLHDMACAGVSHAAMEASSHGLDQHRLTGCGSAGS